jgi:hypothetical protein
MVVDPHGVGKFNFCKYSSQLTRVTCIYNVYVRICDSVAMISTGPVVSFAICASARCIRCCSSLSLGLGLVARHSVTQIGLSVRL